MELPDREDMKVSRIVVRRLRTEHGWSQEQLALAAGVSLRTIQRVEASGAVSMETWTCLAAVFGVDRNSLAEIPSKGELSLAAVPYRFSCRYKIAAAIACATSVPAALGIANVLPAGAGWAAFASLMIALAIALLMYSGFGWYFRDGLVRVRGVRRVAGACFIAIAVFGAFSVLALLTGTSP